MTKFFTVSHMIISKIKNNLIAFLLILLVIAAGIIYLLFSFLKEDPITEIITQSTLEKIVNVNELSTFQAVYVGVAEVMNENNPEKLDYYVYYESKVKAGIDFEKIVLEINHEEKSVTVNLPSITITEVNVDIASLDYIFENDRANTNTVSQQAYKACIEDVEKESSQEMAIFDLAKQNAENIMRALISPFLDQLDEEYSLIINS